MDELVPILIVLGVCVALPVLIVWLVVRGRMNAENKRAEIMIEAMNHDNFEGVNELAKSLKKTERTPLERLMVKLGFGASLTLIGAGLIVISCLMAAEIGFNDAVVQMVFLTVFVMGAGLGLLITFFVQKYLMGKKLDAKAE